MFLLLLIEDNIDKVNYISKKFKHRGVQVNWVSNHEDIIDEVETKRYEALVIDINISGSRAVDLAKEIYGVKPELNIIFVTGFSCMLLDRTSNAIGGRLCPLSAPFHLSKIGEVLFSKSFKGLSEYDNM